MIRLYFNFCYLIMNLVSFTPFLNRESLWSRRLNQASREQVLRPQAATLVYHKALATLTSGYGEP